VKPRSRTLKEQEAQLKRDINMIYRAVDQAEPSRILQRWRKGPNDAVLKAMRRAIFSVDGTLQVTTDALVEAFDAGLRALTRKAKP